MENLTIVGMKELNQKISKMERSLEDIAKALNMLVKIENRKLEPRVVYDGSRDISLMARDSFDFPDREEEDENDDL